MGKLIGLLLFCLPLLLLLFSINVHTKNTRNELARLVMGTIFLVGQAKRDPPLNHLGLDYISNVCILTNVSDTHAHVRVLQ